MKLRNKRTGEIVIANVTRVVSSVDFDCGQTLAELNEEWEDYEEPKEYWYIDWNGEVCRSDIHDERTEQMKQIGNYFSSREEAELALRKLQAWKRLKDNGLVIKKWNHTPDMHLTTGSFLKIEGFIPAIMKNIDDLDLLFGGEE